MSARFSFNCTNGCGACKVRLFEFEVYRSETMAGELVERRVTPQIVSVCCGSDVEIWDSLRDDTAGMVVVTGGEVTDPTPTGAKHG
jgi:hypothetical protein